MSNFNKVILMGHLTKAPELRYSAAGTAIAKLSLAVNRKYRDAQETLHEETTFVDLTAFAELAESVSRYLRKGSPVFVEGRLRLERWETAEKEKRQKLSVVAERIQFLGRKATAEAPASTDKPSADAVPVGAAADSAE